MIVKVQRALYPDPDTVLVYNKDSTLMHQVSRFEVGDKKWNVLTHNLLGDSLKVFWHARLMASGVLKMIKRARWQKW